MDKLLSEISPIAYAIVIIAIAIGLIKYLIKGNYKETLPLLGVGCIIAYMIFQPSNFRIIGKEVVDFVKEIVGSLT